MTCLLVTEAEEEEVAVKRKPRRMFREKQPYSPLMEEEPEHGYSTYNW